VTEIDPAKCTKCGFCFLEKMVIEVLWNKGMKYLGGEIGRKLAKTKIANEMWRQDNQLASMIFRNAPVVMIVRGS
jgi:hypothetical protein